MFLLGSDLEVYYFLDDLEVCVVPEIFRQFFEGYQPGVVREQIYPVVALETLQNVWDSFMDKGYVVTSHEKILDRICEQFTDSFLLLKVSTYLCGHTERDPEEDLTEYGLPEDEDSQLREDFFWRYIKTLSDYGIEPLEKLFLELYQTNTYEKRLVVLDRILNVTHCRSDLAELFVEGGTKSLNILSGRPSEEESNLDTVA